MRVSKEWLVFLHSPFCTLLSELLRRSPFPEFSSTCMPPKVTFLEISAHSLLFSQISPANFLRHTKIVFLQVVFLQVVCLLLSFCRMSACVSLILGSLIGSLGHPGLTGQNLPKSTFFSDRLFEGFFLNFTSLFDPFLKVFSSYLHPFIETYFWKVFLQNFIFF